MNRRGGANSKREVLLVAVADEMLSSIDIGIPIGVQADPIPVATRVPANFIALPFGTVNDIAAGPKPVHPKMVHKTLIYRSRVALYNFWVAAIARGSI
jgi:hypothetical protein